jgi:hypothetical protein
LSRDIVGPLQQIPTKDRQGERMAASIALVRITTDGPQRFQFVDHVHDHAGRNADRARQLELGPGRLAEQVQDAEVTWSEAQWGQALRETGRRPLSELDDQVRRSGYGPD